MDRQAPHHDSRSATKINTTRPSSHNNPTNHISTTRLRDLTSYVEGTDAARLLAERHPNGMPPDEVVRIVTAVAEALDTPTSAASRIAMSSQPIF